tara:strand:- start:472 stop:1755 length:1284 start_codon:yes stop_codon:yes gene_type:complete
MSNRARFRNRDRRLQQERAAANRAAQEAERLAAEEAARNAKEFGIGEVRPDDRNWFEKTGDNINNWLFDRNKKQETYKKFVERTPEYNILGGGEKKKENGDGGGGGGGGETETWDNPWKHRTLRSGRLGANERLPSDLRYPYSTINGTQDFIKFSIFEYRRSTQSRIGIRRDRGDRLFTSGRESLADEQNNLRNTRDLLGSILLPIPSQVADTNSTGWGESKLNALEADLLAASGNLISGQSGKAEGDFQSVLQRISANSSVVNSWFAKQAVSALIGSNITLDQLLARDQGEIINPNMELLFSGPSLRTFSFNFKLTPRYQREAEVIRTIIKAFKRNMAPKGSGGTVLRTPNIFQLEYVGKAQDYLNRIKLCALQNVSVNYTGDGTFATYQDGAPISSMLTLQFKELTPIYNEDYGAYTDNRDGVGY